MTSRRGWVAHKRYKNKLVDPGTYRIEFEIPASDEETDEDENDDTEPAGILVRRTRRPNNTVLVSKF